MISLFIGALAIGFFGIVLIIALVIAAAFIIKYVLAFLCAIFIGARDAISDEKVKEADDRLREREMLRRREEIYKKYSGRN